MAASNRLIAATVISTGESVVWMALGLVFRQAILAESQINEGRLRRSPATAGRKLAVPGITI